MVAEYSWGIDGSGRAHIFKVGEWVILFSMIDNNCGAVGKLLMEGKI